MLTTDKTASSVNLARQSRSTDRPSSLESIAVTNQTVGYQTVHQTPWYLRLKVPRLGDDAEYAQRLLGLVQAIEGVDRVRISPAAKSIAVEFAPLPATQIDLARTAAIEMLERALHIPEPTESHQAAPSEEIDYVQRLGLPVLGLAVGIGVAVGLPIPGVIAGGIVIAAAIPVFQRALNGIQQDKQLNIDFLDGLAISLHASQGRYFPPALMLGLIEGGEVIRDMTARGSERASLDLLDCLNGEVTVERDGQELRISAREIVKGDGVLVYPGE